MRRQPPRRIALHWSPAKETLHSGFSCARTRTPCGLWGPHRIVLVQPCEWGKNWDSEEWRPKIACPSGRTFLPLSGTSAIVCTLKLGVTRSFVNNESRRSIQWPVIFSSIWTSLRSNLDRIETVFPAACTHRVIPRLDPKLTNIHMR